MDLDLIFVVGCVVLVLAVPAIVSAFSDGRTPRAPAIVVMIGGALVYYAVTQRPGAYTLETTPDVFLRVVAQLLS